MPLSARNPYRLALCHRHFNLAKQCNCSALNRFFGMTFFLSKTVSIKPLG
jgi:hypothetical protein